MEQVTIPGEAGVIEALVSKVEGGRAGAVLCHPHPQYGGSLEDATLAALAAACEAEGVSTVRFNFRGVGQSAGVYDDGEGEVRDTISVAAYFCNDAAVEELVLGGYSFGAGIAFSAAAEVQPAKLILVAPPVRMVENIATPSCPILVVVGERDQMVPAKPVAKHFEDAGNVSVRSVRGADHFFLGRHGDVQDLAREFLRGA